MIFDSLGTLPLGSIPISIVIEIGIDSITHKHYIDNIVLTSNINVSIDDIIHKNKLSNLVIFILGELGNFQIILNVNIKNEEILHIVQRLQDILTVFIEKENLRIVPNQDIVLYARKSLGSDLGVSSYLNKSISVLNDQLLNFEIKEKGS